MLCCLVEIEGCKIHAWCKHAHCIRKHADAVAGSGCTRRWKLTVKTENKDVCCMIIFEHCVSCLCTRYILQPSKSRPQSQTSREREISPCTDDPL